VISQSRAAVAGDDLSIQQQVLFHQPGSWDGRGAGHPVRPAV
jgi:hypothetical protein